MKGIQSLTGSLSARGLAQVKGWETARAMATEMEKVTDSVMAKVTVEKTGSDQDSTTKGDNLPSIDRGCCRRRT